MSRTETPAADAAAGTDGEGDPLLEVERLKKHFSQAEGVLDRLVGVSGRVRAVDGVDLAIREGETLAVVGESGCGKSTLGETVVNLNEPTAGSVRYRGEDITDLSDKEMQPYRRNVQMIFQDPRMSLNPRQTVGDILKAPLEVHDIGDGDAERTERAESMLDRVGLKPGHMNRYPNQFSGGQQQRVGLARALMLEPDLVVADEPVSELDVSVQAQILNLLADLQDDLGLSMLFIAHDLSVVRHVADRVAVMYLGEIVETAPVERLFEDPKHPYTRSLLSAVPRTDPHAETDRVILEGTVPSPLNPPEGCRFHTRCPVIIPPADWPADDESFKAGFRYRQRLAVDDVDLDAVRSQLASGGSVDDDAVVDYLLEHSFGADPAALPATVADDLRAATRDYVTGADQQAVEALAETFASPCVDDEPRSVDAADGHDVSCHRVDPDAPGELTTW